MSGREIPRVEFAEQLGVHLRTLDAWRDEGLNGVKLEPIWRGGRIFYTQEMFERWQGEVNKRRERQRRVNATGPKEDRKRQRRANDALRALGVKVKEVR